MKRWILVAASVGALALAVALAPTGSALAQSMKSLLVEVVNVPNVIVANNPMVQAQQSGSWNVGINGVAAPLPVIAARPVADRVVLEGRPVPATACTSLQQTMARCHPDASCESVPFVVPPGKVLVITDVQGLIEEEVAWNPGDVGELVILMSDGIKSRALRVRGEVTPGADVSKALALNAHFQAGRLAGPGISFCAAAGASSKFSSKVAFAAQAEVQGYLIDQ